MASAGNRPPVRRGHPVQDRGPGHRGPARRCASGLPAVRSRPGRGDPPTAGDGGRRRGRFGTGCPLFRADQPLRGVSRGHGRGRRRLRWRCLGQSRRGRDPDAGPWPASGPGAARRGAGLVVPGPARMAGPAAAAGLDSARCLRARGAGRGGTAGQVLPALLAAPHAAHVPRPGLADVSVRRAPHAGLAPGATIAVGRLAPVAGGTREPGLSGFGAGAPERHLWRDPSRVAAARAPSRPGHDCAGGALPGRRGDRSLLVQRQAADGDDRRGPAGAVAAGGAPRRPQPAGSPGRPASPHRGGEPADRGGSRAIRSSTGSRPTTARSSPTIRASASSSRSTCRSPPIRNLSAACSWAGGPTCRASPAWAASPPGSRPDSAR